MSKILELREKRAKAWDAAKSFLDSKRSEGGLLSAEDSTVYDRMEADVVALGKEVERLERQAVIDMELSKPINTPITNTPADPREEEKKGRASNMYKGAFWDAMRNKAPSLEIYNSLKIGSDPDGGVLVPDEYERTLIQALEEECIFRRLARTIQTAHGDRKIPVVASKGEASWVEEEAQIPESDDKFTQISIGAHKVATTIKVSDELLNDSVFNLPAYIATEFARRIGNKEEAAFISGDGAGKPLGILSDTGGGEVGVTTAGATAITFDELMDLFYSLNSSYRRKAVFLMNDLTVKAIRKLKDNTGQY
jgi:HK97 family phage major capsid protein